MKSRKDKKRGVKEKKIYNIKNIIQISAKQLFDF